MYRGEHSGRGVMIPRPWYRGEHSRKREWTPAPARAGRIILLVICFALILSAAAGSTIAFLVDRRAEIGTLFSPAYVSCSVVKTVSEADPNTISVIAIRNTGNVDAYIRAKIVINWIDSSGTIMSGTPLGYSYELTYDDMDYSPEGSSGDVTVDYLAKGSWFAADGSYYYKLPVAAGGCTDALLLECTAVVPQEPQYTLQVEILAEAIQSAPEDAVMQAWGRTIRSDGLLN